VCRRTAPFAAALVAALVPAAAFPSPHAGAIASVVPQDDGGLDLRAVAEAGEPLLIDVTLKRRFLLEIEPEGGVAEKRSTRSEEKLRCVDEFAYVGENGTVVDCELTGGEHELAIECLEDGFFGFDYLWVRKVNR
jgi:hypothetical protein